VERDDDRLEARACGTMNGRVGEAGEREGGGRWACAAGKTGKMIGATRIAGPPSEDKLAMPVRKN